MKINIFINTFPDDFFKLIQGHSDGRITKKAYRMYQKFYLGNLTGTLLVLGLYKNYKLLSVSSCIFTKKKVYVPITVTHRNHRNKGYGNLTMTEKLEILGSLGLKYTTKVALDNKSSLGMCKKSGLKIQDVSEASRHGQPFKIATIGN